MKQIDEKFKKKIKAMVNAYAFADSKFVHLARYGKNKRIRKKNAIRAFWQGYSNYLKLKSGD